MVQGSPKTQVIRKAKPRACAASSSLPCSRSPRWPTRRRRDVDLLNGMIPATAYVVIRSSSHRRRVRGLLELGYVAFYALGVYTAAHLASGYWAASGGGHGAAIIVSGPASRALAKLPARCESGAMRAAPPVVALALLLPASPALAGTAAIETDRQGSATTVRVIYRATPGARDALRISMLRGNDYGDDRFEGAAVVGFQVSGSDVTAGPGCEALGLLGVACPLRAGARLRGPVVYAGDGADLASVGVPAPGTLIFGGPGSDSLAAPLRFQAQMYGGPGNDTLEGSGVLHGGAGADSLSSFPFGAAGPSRIFGGSGSDEIEGTELADIIVPGAGRDSVFAWGGADVIRTSDGFRDAIECGSGRDRIVVDPFDTSDPSLANRPLGGCERLRRRGRPRALPAAFNEWEGDPTVTLPFECPRDGAPRCVGNVTLRRGGRVITRSPVRARAGEWGIVEFRLGRPRIRRLLGRNILIVVRSRGRGGRVLTATLVDALEEVERGGDDSTLRTGLR
jgi:hypothetical protein